MPKKDVNAAQKFKPSRRELILQRFRRINYRRPVSYIQKRPFFSFFIALALLATLILLGSTIFKEKPFEEVKPSLVKAVKVFKIGEAPKVSVQAVAKKSGVIKISAQTPGIVSSINCRFIARLAKLAGAPAAKSAGLEMHVKLGDSIETGARLFTLHAEAPGELEYVLDFHRTHRDAIQITEELV